MRFKLRFFEALDLEEEIRNKCQRFMEAHKLAGQEVSEEGRAEREKQLGECIFAMTFLRFPNSKFSCFYASHASMDVFQCIPPVYS